MILIYSSYLELAAPARAGPPRFNCIVDSHAFNLSQSPTPPCTLSSSPTIATYHANAMDAMIPTEYVQLPSTFNPDAIIHEHCTILTIDKAIPMDSMEASLLNVHCALRAE